MKSLRYLAFAACIILCSYHFLSLHYYYWEVGEMVASGMSSDGSLESQLALTHLALFCLWLLVSVTFVRNWALSTHTALIGAAGIIAIYVWWFLEKYSFLTGVYGLKEGSPEYEEWLSEIGLLRGATNIDYAMLGVSVILLAYGLISAGKLELERYAKN